ncbi:protein-tyrosine phosphatase [Nocardia transvalensis]|uniref:Protein-tyrosine phosphatase n=1 Tax=Nocardia transvalensis TaxID=37333 RepID=A0A7W9PL23_9NOCA|nr:tyrosine-protein phosphatase [Nocardia transvalensis]MBB5918110.1 protein-tyrosine phosphatase [Nocardia transvalensis]
MKTSLVSTIGTAVAALVITAGPVLADPSPTTGPSAPPAVSATDDSPSDERSAAPAGRIELQGAVNVRDIGGYRTYDGKTVKAGKAIRADSLEKLTDADVRKLGSLNLRSAVDLRTPGEVQFSGPDKLPGGVTSVARPVDDTGLFLQMMQVIQSKDPQQQEELLGNGGAERIMQNVYRSFLTDDSRAKFGQTVKDLAAGGKPLLYHCTSGKDRTGWLTYVVLRAVGVPEATARQDYLLSNRYRAAADAKLREQVKQAGLMQNPDLLIPLQEVRSEYLDTSVREVEETYGDFGKFLTQGLGVDPGTLVALRKNLVG